MAEVTNSNQALLDKHKTIVRRWVQDVFNEHKLDMVEHLKVPDYIDWNSYPGQDVFLGGFKAVLMSFFDAFPDFHYDVEEELAEGDMLVCLGTWSGTHDGSFMGIPPSGQRMAARRVDLVRFSGDKMTERWGTGNELKMLQLMGMCEPVEPVQDKQDSEGIARRFIEEVLNRRSPAAIEKLVSVEGGLNTKGVLDLLLLYSAFSDTEVVIEELIAEGDSVTALLTFQGTHSGTFADLPATGKRVATRQILSLELRNGQIVGGSYDFDLGDLAQQIRA